MCRSRWILFLLLSSGLFAADRAPEVVKQTTPIYPPWLLGPALGQGDVVVDFVVTKEGRTAEVKALDPTNPLLRDAAVAAVKQWTFRPATHDGHSVACHMRVPIVFQMNGFLGSEYLDGHFTCVSAEAGGEVPTLISAAEPDFPGKLWRRGVGGKVVVDFTIRRDGTTSDTSVISASQPEFGESVVAAIKRFQFAMDPSYVGTPRVRLEVEFLSAEQQAIRKKSPSQRPQP